MSCSYTRAAVPHCTGHSDVSRIESGERRWDGEVEFGAMAKALKVDLVNLFTRTSWASPARGRAVLEGVPSAGPCE